MNPFQTQYLNWTKSKQIVQPRKIGFKFEDGPFSEVLFKTKDFAKDSNQYKSLIRKYKIKNYQIK